jgi:hypothetical protein
MTSVRRLSLLALQRSGIVSRCAGGPVADLTLGDKDRLCGLVVRVPGFTSEVYCVSCEVRTEFIYVI